MLVEETQTQTHLLRQHWRMPCGPHLLWGGHAHRALITCCGGDWNLWLLHVVQAPKAEGDVVKWQAAGQDDDEEEWEEA